MANGGLKMTRKGVIWLVSALAVALLAGGAGAWWMLTQTTPETPTATATSKPPATSEAPKPITVAAMGDMLPHDSVNKNALQADGTYDYGQFFTNILPLYEEADVVFCNQEVPSAGEAFGITGYPVFNAPEQFAVELSTDAKCSAINLANNHAADHGQAGITLTRNVWDSLSPKLISGTNRSVDEQNKVTFTEVRGVNFALVSFAEYSNFEIDQVSLNFIGNTDLVQRLMATATAQADVVLVSLHWGTEDSHEVNAMQTRVAQQFADLGADVILGTGPHVLQPATWLNRADGGRTLVWYSLGNMLSTQLRLNQRIGVVATFEVEQDGSNVTITNPVAHLTYMHYDWSAEQEAAGDLLARTNLSLNPLASSAELLGRTRFANASVDEILAQMSAILGPDVSVVAD